MTKMTSDESDDEPLATLAAAKKLNPENFPTKDDQTPAQEVAYGVKRKRKRPAKQEHRKRLPVSVHLSRKKRNSTEAVVERPMDVWLYLKDFNTVGPYHCLICPELFINKSKIILHYVLNHSKNYCGICRYFVSDKEAWDNHLEFHSPWPCSQCCKKFPNNIELRYHLKSGHNLVHCRLCHFRLSEDQYNAHLYKRHNVTNVTTQDEEAFWEVDYGDTKNFNCLLCSKTDMANTAFFSHYMVHHRFTLKCITDLLCGRDPPFLIYGADVSSEFIEGLKTEGKCGYVDLDTKPAEALLEAEKTATDSSELLKVLLPEIKSEILSDTEEKVEEANDDQTNEEMKAELEFVKSYEGDEDFDVTAMEVIAFHKPYSYYIDQILNTINSNNMPENSNIDYEKIKFETGQVDCCLCSDQNLSLQAFVVHMTKMHSVKAIPLYSCRICTATFDTQNELTTHITEELADFEDLWLCQFCDKEFENRQDTRKHLTEHWEMVEHDNCFSPHLGFKCKFCPTLFWNENDRETHEVQAHFNKHKEQYYKCEHCSEIFSDKIWFIHHYQTRHPKEESTEAYLLKCCLCCLVLRNIDEMRKHFGNEHPGARKVFCSVGTCQYKPLCHKKSFKYHLKMLHTTQLRIKKEKAVSCSVCSAEFPNLRTCNTHVATTHGPGKFKCKICKEALRSADERKLHYLVKHPGHHPFECTVCGKSFQYKSTLYMHKQDHAANRQSFECTYCHKVFTKKDSFREHLQIHEGPRHACSYCPMRFVQRSNMLRHERRHTGERPYTCAQCPRTFADKGACNSHERTHRRDTSYACIYCGQTFVQRSKLTYHIRKHTGENLETCSLCSKIFTSACSLREHMKVHAAKANNVIIKCPLCDKSYHNESHMIRHMRSSHTQGDYKCPLCGKLVTSRGGLRDHVITHSPLNVYRCKRCSKTSAVKRTMVRHVVKRHNARPSGPTARDLYQILDPRECKLGLDDETLLKIFGRPKRAIIDLRIDFTAFQNQINNDNQNTSQDVSEEEDIDIEGYDEDSKDSEDSESSEQNTKDCQKDNDSGGESQNDDNSGGELEPTDFVSVKIEPMDEDEVP